MIGSRYNNVATALRYHKMTCSQTSNMADVHLRRLRTYGKENYGGSFITVQSLSPAVNVNIEQSGGGDAWRKAGERKSNVEKTKGMLINVSQHKQKVEEIQKPTEMLISVNQHKKSEEEIQKTKEMLINVNEHEETDKEIEKRDREVINLLDFQKQGPYDNRIQLQNPRIRDKRLQAHLFIKLILQETKKVKKQCDIQSNSSMKTTVVAEWEDGDDGISLYGMVRGC